MPKPDENADPSPADENLADDSSTSEDTAADETAVAEEGSPSEKATKPSAREKWFETLTKGRGEAGDETPEDTETESEDETPPDDDSEKTDDGKAPPDGEDTTPDPKARTSTLSDEEFLKRVKPETARRFRELSDARKADRVEITRLSELAKVGSRIERLMSENEIPKEHFERWTDLGVRVARGEKDTALFLFNMAVGLAKENGVELPIPKPSVTDHPAFQSLSKRLTAQIRAGTLAPEEADAILEDLKGSLTPAPSQPAVTEPRRPATPPSRDTPPTQRNQASIFSDPPLAPDIKGALDEMEKKDKAMEKVHGSNWPEIRTAVIQRLDAAKTRAAQAGRTVHPTAFPDLFDQAVEAEIARRKSKMPAKPKVPPTMLPTRQSQKGSEGKSGRERAKSFLTG